MLQIFGANARSNASSLLLEMWTWVSELTLWAPTSQVEQIKILRYDPTLLEWILPQIEKKILRLRENVEKTHHLSTIDGAENQYSHYGK